MYDYDVGSTLSLYTSVVVSEAAERALSNGLHEWVMGTWSSGFRVEGLRLSD